ncbi:hypothetical protein WR25_11120 isoform D [Diploscapter pachys]|uniref:Coiled-coil domain-containing protein 93 n=1 Tax=Diploscapter pachys TaxID=2018661 RepID=A0A2A2JJ03_9BILA|nr:hypothetical protein WR25_11120 isoform B [Diploscapter pachys]PAV61695.1 hypothetical protein WR25_11120 isoform D [Diploscapter pachys]
MDYPSTSNAHQIQFEVRDDEEQKQKLEDCIQLLVASGYFRARISGLKPFDKIVGGLVWCISLCNLSLDVDLLYSDNATIKQKIQVTEKIVRVLPQLECPYSLEPHQIQGLDCIHIYPVVQWFVKKAMEGRVARADQQETLISTITDRHLGKVSKPKASPAAVVSRFIFEEEKKPRSSPSKEVKTAKDELQQLEERIRAAQEESVLLDKELNDEVAQAEIIQRNLKGLELEKQRRDQLKENLSESELEEIRRLVEEMEVVRADEKTTKHEMRDKIQQVEDRIERINLVGQVCEFLFQAKNTSFKIKIVADEDLIREWEHSEAALQQERQLTGEATRKLMECQRQLDSTPSGNEMAQYQQRFIELYNQSNFYFDTLKNEAASSGHIESNDQAVPHSVQHSDRCAGIHREGIDRSEQY